MKSYAKSLVHSLTSNASWGCSKNGGFDTFIITKNNSSYLFVCFFYFLLKFGGRVLPCNPCWAWIGLELLLFLSVGIKIWTPSNSISFNYLNSNQSEPTPLYSTVDALLYKVDGLNRFIYKKDESDVNFRNSEPLSGDGSWGSGLICRILGSDTDFMFQRSNTGHEQEKRLTI